VGRTDSVCPMVWFFHPVITRVPPSLLSPQRLLSASPIPLALDLTLSRSPSLSLTLLSHSFILYSSSPLPLLSVFNTLHPSAFPTCGYHYSVVRLFKEMDSCRDAMEGKSSCSYLLIVSFSPSHKSNDPAALSTTE